MANYTTLREGSSNKEEIARLQQALKDAGYGNYLGNAGVDGIYGSGTKAAVEAYQKDKGLQVDGIAGNQTLGSLYGNSQQVQQMTQPAAPAVPAAPVAAPQQPEYRYDAEADPAYQAAQQKVADVEGQKPVIRGTYDQQVEQLYQDLMGRKNFSYDLNGDALWQQYKDQYTTQGKLAMMDTMGQVAALTGGYGSSYAQGAGQQAYQGYLQQLNDRIPELHQLALQRYQMEQDVLQGKLDTARGMQAEEYARDRDAQSDWLAQLGLAREDAQKAYDRGQSAWYTEEQLRRQDEETAYGREQDAYSKQQNSYEKLMSLIAGTGYNPSDTELAAAGMSRAQATALAAAYEKEVASKSKGSSSTGNEERYATPSVEEEEHLKKIFKDYGYEAGISYAEAHNYEPGIIYAIWQMAQPDQYLDPGA